MLCSETKNSLPATCRWQAKSMVVINKITFLILLIIFLFRRFLLQIDSWIYCHPNFLQIESLIHLKFFFLLQVVEEVVADSFVQVSALMPSHVVRLTWIYEEIWLGTCCDTSLQEGEAVLWHHGHIVQALDNLQFTLQVFSLIE